MKKKPSLLITLALATFMTTGCEALDNFFDKKEETPTEQNEKQKQDEQLPNDGKGEEKEDTKPEPVQVTSVELYEYGTSLDIGEQYQIQVTVLPENADQTVSFETSNEHICEVTQQGLVTAVDSGYASIRVTSEANRKKSAELNIYVNEQETPPLPPEDYTVTFNANGGSGTMAPQTTNGSYYVTPSCSFTYADHSFNGWALNSASGIKYNVGTTIQNISSDIVLYATWTENTSPLTNYTVTFNANGGSGTMANQQTNGDSFVVPSCGFSRSGFVFKNWAYQSINGTKYNPGQTINNIDSNFTLYAIWQESSSVDTGAGDYYDGLSATSGTALLGELHDLSVTKHTSYNSYSGVSTTNCIKTDPYQDTAYVMDFYSGAPTQNTITSSGTVGWNREHVWCQDLSNGLYGKSGAGADIQHIRPTIPSLNSDRGNKKYGELNNSGTASTATDVNGNTAYGGYYSGSTFQPMNNKKGDAARIVMYLYMHYNKATNISGTKDDVNHPDYFGTLNFTHVMASSTESAAIQLLLSWNAADPVDSIEILRNNEAAKITGCRNPFIDHAEYANLIWG